MAVKIVTDSTSYIKEDIKKDLDIKTVNLSVHFPDESFDETIVEYGYFYQKIEADNVIPTSSQPSLGQIYSVFRDIVEKGEEVLGIFISAKMSSTYNTALSAKKMIKDKYPQASIEIIDSQTNCMAMGIQVIEAAMAAKAGKKMDEIIDTVHSVMKKIHFYFVPASLKYLIKGGRIGGASALIGSLLQIRPILYVNNGMTDVLDKVRGTRLAVKRMLHLLSRETKKYGLRHLIVHNIYDEKRGNELAETLSKQYNREVLSLPIGPVIGLHVGPGTVGIVFCTEE